MSKSNLRGIAGEMPGAAERPSDGQSESAGGVGTVRPDPEVPAKAKRRQFSAEYKRQILREADAAAEPFHPNFADAQGTQLVLDAVERSAISGGTATTPGTAPD